MRKQRIAWVIVGFMLIAAAYVAAGFASNGASLAEGQKRCHRHGGGHLDGRHSHRRCN